MVRPMNANTLSTNIAYARSLVGNLLIQNITKNLLKTISLTNDFKYALF